MDNFGPQKSPKSIHAIQAEVKQAKKLLDVNNKYNIVRLVLQSGVQTVFFRVTEWNVKEVLQHIEQSNYELTDFRYFWFEKRLRTLKRDNKEELLFIEVKTVSSSPSYYINSYIETIEDIIVRNNAKERWLIEKMQNLNWSSVVTSVEPKEDWYYRFNDEDFLIDINGNIVNESVV